MSTMTNTQETQCTDQSRLSRKCAELEVRLHWSDETLARLRRRIISLETQTACLWQRTKALTVPTVRNILAYTDGSPVNPCPYCKKHGHWKRDCNANPGPPRHRSTRSPPPRIPSPAIDIVATVKECRPTPKMRLFPPGFGPDVHCCPVVPVTPHHQVVMFPQRRLGSHQLLTH